MDSECLQPLDDDCVFGSFAQRSRPSRFLQFPQSLSFWMAAIDTMVDVHKAIDAAFQSASIDNFERLVLYFHYWLERTFVDIAEALDVHVDVVRRAQRRALKAIEETGLLEGYADVG